MIKEWFSWEWFSADTLRQFDWAYPWMFYGLGFIPFVFLLKWVFVSKNTTKIDLELPAEIAERNWTSYLRLILPLCQIIFLTLLCIALARPQKVLMEPEDWREGLNIVLALDISESMEFDDLKPNRLEAAKAVATQFLDGLKNDKVGLVIFAGEAQTLCPLTTDYDLLKSYIKDIKTNAITISGTAIGNALAASINRLRESPERNKAIILISDGDNTAGTFPPETAALLSNSFQIRIYTIAIGNQSDSELNLSALKDIAQKSGGKSFVGKNSGDLYKVFSDITLIEKDKLLQMAGQDYTDYYAVYLFWAIIIFLFWLLLKNTFLGNILED